jgi:hypothetical protein
MHSNDATLDFGTRRKRSFHQPDSYAQGPAYSPDAVVVLTPFSEAVLQELYFAVKHLAGTKVKSANVSWSSTEEGTDYRFDLVVRVDVGWNDVDAWEYAILDEVTEWSESWTDLQWTDYSQHIFHSLVPAQL